MNTASSMRSGSTIEHAGLTMKEIELATMAARGYGMDHFVRLPATDYATVMRPSRPERAA